MIAIHVYKIWDSEDPNYDEWYGDIDDIVEYIADTYGVEFDYWEDIIECLTEDLNLDVKEVYSKTF